ncbi:hypothetical protein H8959_006527 [Pygathrix nigripes]
MEEALTGRYLCCFWHQMGGFRGPACHRQARCCRHPSGTPLPGFVSWHPHQGDPLSCADVGKIETVNLNSLDLLPLGPGGSLIQAQPGSLRRCRKPPTTPTRVRPILAERLQWSSRWVSATGSSPAAGGNKRNRFPTLSLLISEPLKIRQRMSLPGCAACDLQPCVHAYPQPWSGGPFLPPQPRGRRSAHTGSNFVTHSARVLRLARNCAREGGRGTAPERCSRRRCLCLQIPVRRARAGPWQQRKWRVS